MPSAKSKIFTVFFQEKFADPPLNNAPFSMEVQVSFSWNAVPGHPGQGVPGFEIAQVRKIK